MFTRYSSGFELLDILLKSNLYESLILYISNIFKSVLLNL